MRYWTQGEEGLEGPWEPHRRNPVKCDVRGSRPAGTPFVHGGELYRPAQDGSKRYGKASSRCCGSSEIGHPKTVSTHSDRVLSDMGSEGDSATTLLTTSPSQDLVSV